MKIKQKKTLSCVCGVFYPIARIDYVSHHCVLLQTHKKLIFSFQVLERHFFSSIFWNLPPLFS